MSLCLAAVRLPLSVLEMQDAGRGSMLQYLMSSAAPSSSQMLIKQFMP